MIDVQCSGCGKKIKVSEKHAGKKGKCPVCKNLVIIPKRELDKSERITLHGSLPQKESTTLCARCLKTLKENDPKADFKGEVVCVECYALYSSKEDKSSLCANSESNPASQGRGGERNEVEGGKSPEEGKRCPYCAEVILKAATKCKHCGEFLDMKPAVGAKTTVETNVKQGALIGAVVCFSIGVGLMCLTLWSAVMYAPLFLAAFVLSIVAMAQRRVFGGVVMLLLTVLVPPVLFLVLGAIRTSEALEDISKAMEATASPPTSSASPSSGNRSVDRKMDMGVGATKGQESSTVNTVVEQANRQKVEYLQLLDIYDLQAKYYTSFMDEKVPGVKFKLRNRGGKVLSKVQVTVYFRDGKGTIVSEEDYLPVLVSSYSFESGKPLRPNYIWQMEKGKFYQAKNVPSEWEVGNVIARVTEIEFSRHEDAQSGGLESDEKRAYRDQVDIYDFQAKYFTSLMDERVPGVAFKLRNRGNRALKKVEVTVYFKDEQGRVISEEDYHPVLVSSFSVSMDSGKPLKANYIWQMERGKFYEAKNVPSEWAEGAAVPVITDLEFAEQ